MIKLSEGPSEGTLQTVLIVAFNTVTGEVHGTFAYGSYGEDTAGVARSRRGLLKELRSQLGAKVKLETVELPPGKVPGGTIRRVDPKTRKLVLETRDLNSRGGVPMAGARRRRGRAKR
jgi:hypothetical protein